MQTHNTYISASPHLNDFEGFLNSVSERLKISTFILLCDENTHVFAFPLIHEALNPLVGNRLMVIPAGENRKTITTVTGLVDQLTAYGADRNSLLINLGGGVICDLGGFTASVFKRGIRYINIPTTLLAQTDAAVGGKTGVNHKGIKNHIGTFCFPDSVYIHTGFLKTLPHEQWLSGVGELIKYALVGAELDPDILGSLTPDDNDSLRKMISQCIRFKMKVVADDPFDKGSRRALNFGHTVGHALESAVIFNGNSVTHGEAVAAGILAESWLSHRITGLKKETLARIIVLYHRLFGSNAIAKPDEKSIVELMVHDKKNSGQDVVPVLINDDFLPVFDIAINHSLASEAVRFMLSHIPEK